MLQAIKDKLEYEAPVVICFGLVFDLLFLICREGIALSEYICERDQAITTLFFLCFLLTCVMVYAFAYACLRLCLAKQCLCIPVFYTMLHSFAMVPYLIGDNLKYIRANNYTVHYNCGNTCDKTVRDSSTILLGIAILSYFVSKWTKKRFGEEGDEEKDNNYIPRNENEKDNKSKTTHSVLSLVSLIALINLVYSSALPDTESSCPVFQGISSAFFFICVVAGAVYIILDTYKYCDELPEEDKKLEKVYISVCALCCIFALPMYLLADNLLPMGCSYDNQDIRIVRLVLAILSLLLVLFSLRLWPIVQACSEDTNRARAILFSIIEPYYLILYLSSKATKAWAIHGLGLP